MLYVFATFLPFTRASENGVLLPPSPARFYSIDWKAGEISPDLGDEENPSLVSID